MATKIFEFYGWPTASMLKHIVMIGDVRKTGSMKIMVVVTFE